jgi:putative methyltransferase (TIGR04325 family)
MTIGPRSTSREILIDKPISFLLNRLRRLPLAHYVAHLVYEQHFARASGCQRLFRGVYPTFEDAKKAAPRTKPVRYDDTAYCYEKYHRSILSSDYPVIYWMSRILPECSSVVDFGGNVGMAFYSYQKYITYPAHLCWLVYDIPEVVEAGLRIRGREGSPAGLAFTTTLSDCAGGDILLASGSLQYVSDTLPQVLGGIGSRPRHLLLNKLPVCEGDSFVTLQSTGTGFSPYRITNRKVLLDQLASLGYGLEDAWDNPGMPLVIPGEPAHSLTAFSGMYFRRRDTHHARHYTK